MNKQLLLFTGIISLAMSSTLTSCFSKGTVVRADDYDAETIVDLMNEEEPVVKVTPTVKPQHNKKQVVSTPLDGEWTIVEVGKQRISQDDDMPYVIFSDNDGRFYASNGCNIINGDFHYADHWLTISNTVSTLRSCPDIQYPDEISRVLKDGVKVNTKIEKKNRESFLYLLSEKGANLLTLRKHNLETINGQWAVKYIDKEEVKSDEINLFFDIPERKVHGNTGCNFFNGTIVINPDEPSSIAFSHMGVTMKYCDNADIERKLLVALEETECYEIKDGRTLFLTDRSGHRLVTLQRIGL